MHKKPKADLLPLDTKIERKLKNLRKITVAESRSMENQRERLQEHRELRGLKLWRTFEGLLSKRSTL